MMQMGITYPEAQRSLGIITPSITRSLGQEADMEVVDFDVGPAYHPYETKTWRWIWAIASTASAGLSAYHGYRRNQSVGWAIGWALLGGAFPVITPAVAFAQGFGQRK